MPLGTDPALANRSSSKIKAKPVGCPQCLDLLIQVSPGIRPPAHPRAAAAGGEAAEMREFEAVTGIFERFRARSGLPAVAFGVIADGELAYGGGSARADEEPPTSDSVFRIASMTKSFTAASVLLLRDRGRLRLDDPVTQHVTTLRDVACPYPTRWPTLRELMMMSGGLPTDDPWADRMESASDEQFDAVLRAGVRVISAPGTGFSYSNLGYALLGRAIAEATSDGQTPSPAHERYREFVVSEFVRPLGLSSTAFSAGDLDQAQLVTGYRPGTAGWVEVPWSAPGAFSPIGGLFSSVRDLARWVGFLVEAQGPTEAREVEAPLSVSSRLELQQAHQFVSVRGGITNTLDLTWRPFAVAAGYGFGVEVDHDAKYGQIVGHSGGYPGYGSHMCWHPDSGIGVIALANATYARPAQAARAALEQLLEDLMPARRPPTVTDQLRSAAAAAEAVFNEATADRHGLSSQHQEGWDEVFAANIDLDLPRSERLAQWRSVATAAGASEQSPTSRQTLLSDDAGQVSWSRTGTSGVLHFALRFTPEAAPRCQAITVTTVPKAAAILDTYVRRILASIAGDRSWPDNVPVADRFDRATFEREATLVHALIGESPPSSRGRRFEPERVLPALGAEKGETSFRVRGDPFNWALTITLDEEAAAQHAPRVRSCRLEIRPTEWKASPRPA